MTASGIAGLILGILALVTSWIPIINNFAFFLGAIALILGIVAFIATKPQGKRQGRGLAIATVVVAVLSIAITLGTQYLFSKALDLQSSVSAPSTSAQSDKAESAPAEKPADTAAKTDSDGKDDEGDVADGKYHIKITSVTKSVANYNSKPTVAVGLEVTNNQKDKESNIFDYNVQAFQNGVELETAVYLNEKPEGYEAADILKKIQPGGTLNYVRGYVLSDETSPVTVKVSGTFSDGEISKEFSLQ
ncbi:DUF308 domain-containing protein [Canibacter sp. lx-45]|uniref:DUF5067 domain-containing protein n=1 Tax=Canibacter zhuwentaonis TaxID=2837491 RepID=UPI001BDCEB09|nr:DUF5067 domain-containing protein [Canibacter zhuwentaonis]MBT1035699.1 DUF308 domain-containing protein [Canibacter zhuwentaonis]